MSLDHSDPAFKQPRLCKTCGRLYAYKRGQCYECYSADECEHADQQRKERQIERHFGREKE